GRNRYVSDCKALADARDRVIGPSLCGNAGRGQGFLRWRTLFETDFAPTATARAVVVLLCAPGKGVQEPETPEGPVSRRSHCSPFHTSMATHLLRGTGSKETNHSPGRAPAPMAASYLLRA